MARKKVKLAWIANDSARRATFKKRKKGLMKKVSELSTLCGVNAVAIIYSPYDSQPDVWPSPSDAHRVLTRFKSLPEMEQSKKMMNQEGFLRQRISKVKEQLRKQQKENREYDITQLMYQSLGGNKGLHDVCLEDLSDLAWLLEEKMKGIQERMDLLNKFSNTTTTTNTSTVINHPQLVGDHHHYHQKMNKSSTNTNTNTTTTSTTMINNGDHHHHHHHPHHHHQQQQQQHVSGVGGGAYHVGGGTYHDHHHHQEEKMGLDVAMEALKRNQWFMEVHEHIGCGGVGGVGGGGLGGGGVGGGDEFGIPYYGDNSTWSTFFP